MYVSEFCFMQKNVQNTTACNISLNNLEIAAYFPLFDFTVCIVLLERLKVTNK